MLAFNVKRGPDIFFSTNGYGAGESAGYLGAFLIASLASLYVMYGFDTASSLGEETVEPRRTAPKAIFRAILASFVIGGGILVFAVMSAPNLDDPKIGESSGGLQYIVEQVMWGPLGTGLPGLHRRSGHGLHAGRAHCGHPADLRDGPRQRTSVRREARPGSSEDPDPDRPRGRDRVDRGHHPGDQHRTTQDLHGAYVDRHHHDLPGLPDGDRADAEEAPARTVAAKGSQRGWLLHDGQVGPAGQHLRGAVGHH